MGVIRDARVGKGLISAPIKLHKTLEYVVQKEVGNQQQQETRRIESSMEVPLQWSERIHERRGGA